MIYDCNFNYSLQYYLIRAHDAASYHVDMSAVSTTESKDVPSPSRKELFIGFLKVGMQGFGGVLPFARRMLVEQTRWLTPREFTEVLSLSQFLPGPNIINVSIIVGNRYGGPLGSAAASIGLMLMPFLIVLALAALYAHFADIAAVRGATDGVSAAATGLIITMGFRMTEALKGSAWQMIIAALAFVAIAILRVPLLWVLAVLAPVSIIIAWYSRP
jgi:chromate transporter